MSDDWYVEIRPVDENEADPGFRRFGPMSERRAEKVEDGLNINLDHEHYYTRICRPMMVGQARPQR